MCVYVCVHTHAYIAINIQPKIAISEKVLIHICKLWELAVVLSYAPASKYFHILPLAYLYISVFLSAFWNIKPPPMRWSAALLIPRRQCSIPWRKYCLLWRCFFPGNLKLDHYRSTRRMGDRFLCVQWLLLLRIIQKSLVFHNKWCRCNADQSLKFVKDQEGNSVWSVSPPHLLNTGLKEIDQGCICCGVHVVTQVASTKLATGRRLTAGGEGGLINSIMMSTVALWHLARIPPIIYWVLTECQSVTGIMQM